MYAVCVGIHVRVCKFYVYSRSPPRIKKQVSDDEKRFPLLIQNQVCAYDVVIHKACVCLSALLHLRVELTAREKQLNKFTEFSKYL